MEDVLGVFGDLLELAVVVVDLVVSELSRERLAGVSFRSGSNARGCPDRAGLTFSSASLASSLCLARDSGVFVWLRQSSGAPAVRERRSEALTD